MKKLFILITLLLGINTAWGHDAEVDGIFYKLYKYNKTATVTFKGDKYYSYDNEYSGDIVIPENVTVDGTVYTVTSLGEYCFGACRSLTSITIPNSVTSLGYSCFYWCSGLTSITIPNSVTSFGEHCFDGCSGLTSITIPNSVTSLGYACFYGCSGLTSITIPNSVTSLENSCFDGCSGLTSITIPNSVTSLGYACFGACSGLTSITIPNSVTSLGDACFAECDGLESIVVAADNPVYDSRENCNAIIETSTNQMIAGCKNSQIPESVTSLGYYCFAGCSGLTSITIPNTVTSLRGCCFWACSGLTSITIPESVTSLGEYCFKACSGLTSITIPNSVTSLGYYCFSDCKGLTSITIPNSVTSLGWCCFSDCSSLTSITMLPPTPPAIGLLIFSGTSLKTVYVADEEAKTRYEAVEPWNAYEIIALTTGIENTGTKENAAGITGCYDLNGRRVSGKQSGPVIVRYSDGSTRKVVVK